MDVFADAPLTGNGLAVIITDEALEKRLMERLTSELRQFEAIFIVPSQGHNVFSARVFTLEEELPFAGHPALGAAAVLHDRLGGITRDLLLEFPGRKVALQSSRRGDHYHVSMNQGPPGFGVAIPDEKEPEWLRAFGLEMRHRDRRVPMSVVSCGLPYLILPVTTEGLGCAQILAGDLEHRLATVGAKFVYILDIDSREGRTWDNCGLVEDIATGSAAGPVAGLLVRYGFATSGETVVLQQGRYVGRPSKMTSEICRKPGGGIGDAIVRGSVVMVARGKFEASVSLESCFA